jgi:glycosyltransferase involved in cell wall biosynthesis
VSEPDGGVYDAMNKAIVEANGDYIYFIGSGDILLNVLTDVAAKLIDPDCIYYGDVFWVEKQKIYDGPFSPYKLAIKNICHQAIFYPVKALRQNNFNTRYATLADHFLNIQLYGNRKFKFRYIKLLICRYRGAGLSSKNPIDQNYFSDRMKLIRGNFTYPVFCYAYLRTKFAKLIKLLPF